MVLGFNSSTIILQAEFSENMEGLQIMKFYDKGSVLNSVRTT